MNCFAVTVVVLAAASSAIAASRSEARAAADNPALVSLASVSNGCGGGVASEDPTFRRRMGLRRLASELPRGLQRPRRGLLGRSRVRPLQPEGDRLSQLDAGGDRRQVPRRHAKPVPPADQWNCARQFASERPERLHARRRAIRALLQHVLQRHPADRRQQHDRSAVRIQARPSVRRCLLPPAGRPERELGQPRQQGNRRPLGHDPAGWPHRHGLVDRRAEVLRQRHRHTYHPRRERRGRRRRQDHGLHERRRIRRRLPRRLQQGRLDHVPRAGHADAPPGREVDESRGGGVHQAHRRSRSPRRRAKRRSRSRRTQR